MQQQQKFTTITLFLLLLGLSLCACTESNAADSNGNNNKNNNSNDAAASKDEGVFNGNVKVFTVATSRTDGYLRYIRSARVYDIEVTTLGLDKEWKGGDMNRAGGGYKINLLREAIEPLKDSKDTIILFTDSYDVIFTSGLKEIVEKFTESGAKLLFSAEKYCWPDLTLEDKYPPVDAKASQYLNSGAFIGYAPQVYALLEQPIEDTEDDQLYYTKVFLDEVKRTKLDFKLDTQSKLFQNLHGAKDDVKLKVDLDSNQGELHNINFLTEPSIVHGNGLSKVDLNAYGNYLAKTFSGICTVCQEYRIELDEKNLPTVTLALIVTQPVPFFDLWLNEIGKINYPKEKLHLYIYCNAALHDDDAKSFLKKYEKEYASVKMVHSSDELSERRGRELAIEQAKKHESDYIFFIDADAHIDDVEILRQLLAINKQFVAPIFSKYNELWSNFWGALSDGGYYARSHDYVDIVKRDLLGMWNVPYVSSIYLIKNTAFDAINYKHEHFDVDMAMCDSLRNAGIFMYVSNEHYHGHLTNVEDFDSTLFRPDFHTIFTNKYDWARKYIHPDYAEQLNESNPIPQPCTDVFWFKIASEAFCDDLVAIVENFGQWSDGSNSDKRLEGGYEAVPTRDIHMKQVGLDAVWLSFLQNYVRPLQERVFAGYFHNPPRSLMNFMVRYRPDEQPSLRPHHDSSTYTINIAMNHRGIDFEGGGCRFLRYNCSVTDTKKGWMLMHPGRLTHYHEGLLVTNGTRYIMISFIDP